ncbi:hypothetical protein HUJ04_010960 [Dendroctonus ponderosae]|nr:hypothetical protein HUJ04_010960 [Dendroctonus ponderosae]
MVGCCLQCDKVRPVPKKRQVTEEELQMHLGGAVASAALGIGMDMQRVKLALKQRLELTGRGYSQPDALVEAALNLQLDEDDGFDSNSSGNNQLGTIIGAALNDINKASESNGQNQLTAQDTAPCQPHHSDTNGERTARQSDLPCDFKLKKSISLEEENRILKEARQCKICMDAEVGIVFLPCGHLTTCVNCAPNLEDCPMCRSAIKATQCDKVRPVPKKRQVTEEELQMHLGGAVASAALGIGMDMQRVKLALKQRLELTGRGYSQPDALVEAALNLQLDEDDGFDSNSSGNNQLGTIIGAALNDINKASESNGQNQLTAQDTAPCQPHHSDTNGERTARQSDLPCDFKLKKSISLEEENRILKEARQCKICMDAEVGIVFLPCGHLTTCVNCAPNLEDCPMCRSAIKATVRTFLS